MPPSEPVARRQLLTAIVATGSAAALPAAAASGKTSTADNDPPHKIVYQLNHPEETYQEAILNSVGALITKYVDDVAIVVVAWGPGIHLLAKKPKRAVSKVHQQRVKSMSESYGVRFVACGNTMHTLGWSKEDMLDFVTVEDVGAAAVMELQEKGYAYLAW
jgi:uncharacterized protein